MKKILYLVVAMSLCIAASAQQANTTKKAQKGYLGFTAGAAIPVGAFGSTNTTDGGMATTGFQTTIHGGYAIVPRFGIGANIFYASYKLNTEMFTGTGVKLDHWQYYGTTVGPFIDLVKTPKAELALKAGFGFATANAPVIRLENQSTNDTWASAFAAQWGADFKYQIGKGLLLMVNAEYTGMRPTFKDASLGEYRQNIYAIHLGAGLGFRF